MKKLLIKLFVVVVFGFMFVGCSNDGAPEGYSRIYNKALIGYYELHHDLPNGTPVFLVGTPRGLEYCVGRENLQYSLDVYRENGIYGKPYENEGGDTVEEK